MHERQSDWPCLICGRELTRVFDDEGQPHEGITLRTSGNYGSTVYDSFSGEVLGFNICDFCLKEKTEAGRVMITQSTIPVTCGDGIAGSYPVDRPWVPWRVDMEESNERLAVEFEEVIENTYPKSILWNDRGQSGWPEMLVAGYLHSNPEELADVKAHYQGQQGPTDRLNKMMADYEKLLESRAAQIKGR